MPDPAHPDRRLVGFHPRTNPVLRYRLRSRRRDNRRPHALMAGLLALIALSALLALSSCAPATTPPLTATPEPAAEALWPSQLKRPIPYPVTESPQFTKAVANDTRTETGAPGKDYWTNFADYRMEAKLHPATDMLTGHSRVVYHNRSPNALHIVKVHLRQNIYAPGNVRDRTVGLTGGIKLTRVVYDGHEMQAPDVEPPSTVMTIALPDSIPSLGTATFEFEWQFKVPHTPSFRMGTDGEVYFLGYWYPQIAVYDDVNGWVADPYLGDGEFYMDYANYDVSLTVPASWLVAATGTLQNPTVLSERTRARLASARTDTGIVHVVLADERGHATARDTGTLTWHFTAENTRDFAWGTSEKYVWDATHAVVGDRDGDGRPDTAMIYTFYRPDRTVWQNSAAFARNAIEAHSAYVFPYPYPQMTGVEGIIGGGMEYPMIALMGTRRTNPERFYALIAHEYGHMWFPMVVGSNEKRHTWMDEGLTSFIEAQATHKRWNQPLGINPAYLRIAGTGREVEMMRHGDRYPIGSIARVVAGYSKPESILHMLRALLGDEVFHRAFRQYADEWRYKHPTPYDFFNTFETVAGRQLDWFWTPWFYTTWTLDQSVARVEPSGDSVAITIRDLGRVPMPVPLTVTRADSSVEHLEIPVDVWLADRTSTTVEVVAKPEVVRVEIDAEKNFADVNRSNNVWERKAGSGTGGA